MSIASLGGPLNARYLTLPRTKVRDAISFATGGWIPEIGDASDEEILAMVQRGEISPQMANKIIMERAAAGPNAPTVELQKGKVPNLFPESGQQLDQSQVAQMNAMQRQGGRPEDVSPPTGAGGGISSMIPQAVKDWWGSTPSNPLTTPQAMADRQAIGDRIGMRGRPDTGAPTPPNVMPRLPDPMEPTAYPTTDEIQNAPSIQSGTPARGYNPPPEGDPMQPDAYPKDDRPWAFKYGPKAWDWIKGGGFSAGRQERDDRAAKIQSSDARTNDPNSLTPAGIPPDRPAGVSSLPNDSGAASPQAGGIVPSLYKDYENEVPRSAQDDPNALTPADVFTQPAGPPEQDPMAPEAYPRSDPNATGTTVPPAGVPQAGDGGIGDLLKKMNQSPNVRASVEGADGLFGGGRGWEALTMLGLGLMASKNPSALGALGEAGLGTVKYLGERRKEDRDEKRLANQDRRLDEAERRSAFRDELAVRQFGYTQERDKIKDKQVAADDIRKDKQAESTIAKDKALIEYYNRGGHAANTNIKEGERVSQARMIMQMVEKDVEDTMKGIDATAMTMQQREAAKARVRASAYSQYGFTQQGMTRIINDALGMSTPSAAATNGTRILEVTPAPRR